MRTLSSAEVQNLLLLSGVYTEVGRGAHGWYVLPERGWVQGEFASGFGSFLYGHYVPEPHTYNKCSDFADYAVVYARICHQQNAQAARTAALLFGWFWFQQDVGPAHAVNFTVDVGGDGFELVFFDPIKRLLVGLSDAEVMSCFRYGF